MHVRRYTCAHVPLGTARAIAYWLPISTLFTRRERNWSPRVRHRRGTATGARWPVVSRIYEETGASKPSIRGRHGWPTSRREFRRDGNRYFDNALCPNVRGRFRSGNSRPRNPGKPNHSDPSSGRSKIRIQERNSRICTRIWILIKRQTHKKETRQPKNRVIRNNYYSGI